MRTFTVMAIVLIFLIGWIEGIAGEKEALELAAALGMEERWREKVVVPAVEGYLDRLRTMGREPPSDAALSDLRVQMLDRLSWARVGRSAVLAAYGACSATTLVDMRRLLRREGVDLELADRTIADFKECTRGAEAVLQQHLARAVENALGTE